MNRSAILIIVLGTALVGCAKNEDSAEMRTGKAIFNENCAVCHGPGGDIRRAEKQDPDTPDLRKITADAPQGRLPRVVLREVIDGRRIVQAHGERAMPVWGELFATEGDDSANEKIDALVEYIASIQTR